MVLMPLVLSVSVTVRALYCEPSRDRDLHAVSHVGGQNAEKRVKDAVDGGLALARLCGNCRDELGTVE